MGHRTGFHPRTLTLLSAILVCTWLCVPLSQGFGNNSGAEAAASNTAATAPAPSVVAHGHSATAMAPAATIAPHAYTATAKPGGIPPSLMMDEAFIRDVRAAIDELYNRDLDAALDKLSIWRSAWPEHPVWPMWKALDAWWPILIDLENTTYDEAFLQKAEKALEASENILAMDPNHMDALIVRSVMNGQIARYYSNRHRWYRSFLHGRRALRDFFRLEDEHPEMPDMQFGLGMYRYFTAFLVEEYTIARTIRWMLPSGDRAEGLERLAIAADSSVFVEPEATYFLGHIYLHFESQPDKALGHLRDLYHRYPSNSYYRRLYIRSLYQLSLYSDALAAIEESLDHPFHPDTHESLTMREDLFTIRGLIRYYHLADFRLAESDFLEAVSHAEKLTPFAERTNLIVSLYYLGQISIRNDRRDMARFYFSRAATPDIDHPHVKKAREALRTHRLN